MILVYVTLFSSISIQYIIYSCIIFYCTVVYCIIEQQMILYFLLLCRTMLYYCISYCIISDTLYCALLYVFCSNISYKRFYACMYHFSTLFHFIFSVILARHTITYYNILHYVVLYSQKYSCYHMFFCCFTVYVVWYCMFDSCLPHIILYHIILCSVIIACMVQTFLSFMLCYIILYMIRFYSTA